MSRPSGARFEPLLGTVVEVRALVRDGVDVDVPARVADEVRRLEAVLSIHDPGSEISRWRRGDLDTTSTDLTEVLALAVRWQAESNGAFNVATRPATDLWAEAARAGRPPSDERIRQVADAIRSAPYRVVERQVGRVGDCSAVDLNAIAKGWIVDRALDAVQHLCDEVVVNAGGDLAHRGTDGLVVGVEDPHRPYDNVAPLARVVVRNAAIATSGTARRGVRVAGTRHGHVLDPRTARPTDAVASVSVVAGDAATADVLATVVGVTAATDVDEALTLAKTHDAAVLLVFADRSRVSNPAWDGLASGAPRPT